MPLFPGGYLEDWRRALTRARAEAKNAPAEPTTARMAVGFSGEVSQPPCACSGMATANRRARLRNFKADFIADLIMDGLRVERYLHSGANRGKVNLSERKYCFGCTIRSDKGR